MPPHLAAMMHRWADLRDWQSVGASGDARIDARRAKMQDWQRQIVQIERDVFVSMRDSGRLSEDVLRSLQNDLDLEEALLESRSVEASGGSSEEGADAHLEAAAVGGDGFGTAMHGRFGAGRAGFVGMPPGSGTPPVTSAAPWARLDPPGPSDLAGDATEGRQP
jgi:hypothetical protein